MCGVRSEQLKGLSVYVVATHKPEEHDHDLPSYEKALAYPSVIQITSDVACLQPFIPGVNLGQQAVKFLRFHCSNSCWGISI